MNTRFLIGLALGMIGALMLNVGKGVQKQKVHVLLHGRRMFAAEHRRDLSIWCLGLGMTTSALFFFPLGIRFSDSPSCISAMTGIGLIGLVLYALLVIGEKMRPSDVVGVALVIAGTTLLGYLGSTREILDRQFVQRTLVLTVGSSLTAAFLLCLAVVTRWRRWHGVSFGMTAGLLIGIGIFLVDIAQVHAGKSFSAQLGTPYLYLAFSFAVLAMVITQIGFLRGRALEVVPAVNSATILAPLLLEMFIYGVVPAPLTLALIGVIFLGVFLLSTGTAMRVSV